MLFIILPPEIHDNGLDLLINLILLSGRCLYLRTDSCDERQVYKIEYISGSKGGTHMFNTSPKSSDFCLSKDIW